LAQWLGLLAGKQTGNSTARTELRATGAGSGTYDETTDSQEALRDRGDVAWTTGNTTAPLDAAGTRAALGMAAADLDDQLDAIKSDTAAILADTSEIGLAGAGLTEAGGTGDQLTAVPWNAAWDAEVQSEATDALNAYDPPTKTEIDAGFAALNDLDATEVQTAAAAALNAYDPPTNAEMEARTLTTTDRDKLSQHLEAVLVVIAAAGGSTTEVPLNTSTGVEGAVPSAVDGFYNGAALVWRTGALAGQRTSVSDYDGTTKTLTVVGMTGAPSAGDIGLLV
ncbi:MAG TPA: hypothetical protein VFU47_02795, partial [Armatimonadota bacterium]|nr:hypothetical protein [Armatimonadota bacterium]